MTLENESEKHLQSRGYHGGGPGPFFMKLCIHITMITICGEGKKGCIIMGDVEKVDRFCYLWDTDWDGWSLMR